MENNKRFLELDVFRGIASLGVVLFHFTTSYKSFYQHPTHLYFYFIYGEYGVQLFFMISGFVILMTLEKTKNTLDFIVGRIARLYPVYWVCTAITLLIFYGLKIDLTRVIKAGIIGQIFNFTMMQELFNIPNINIVYWSLTIELCFYIIMYIFYKTKGLKHIEIISGVWLILIIINSLKAGISQQPEQNISLFTHNYNYHLIFINPTLDVIKEYIKFNFLLLRGTAQFFIAGMILYRAKLNNFTWDKWLIIGLCVLAQILDYSDKNNWIKICLFILFIITFYLSFKNKLAWINVKPLIFMGTISYSLYLIHLNVGWVLIPWLKQSNIYPDISIVITTILSIIFAGLITFFIEQPSLKFIKNKYKQLSNQ